jgi:hypothetical protein
MELLWFVMSWNTAPTCKNNSVMWIVIIHDSLLLVVPTQLSLPVHFVKRLETRFMGLEFLSPGNPGR